MAQATFRFYAQLNFFLPYGRRQIPFIHEFNGRASIKDMIESFGVPHTEVGLILANSQPVDFSYIVQDDDRISVYPPFETIDVSPVTHVRPEPLRDPRFVLDAHLGKLAGYLRLLGFDSVYRNDIADDELARVSSEENRIVLTRDRGVLKRSIVRHGYYVRSTAPRQQLIEVLRHFDLFDVIKPLRRCIRCNGLLGPVPKEAILDRLPPKTQQYYDEFRICQHCGQIYWEGAHFRRLQQFIEHVLAQEPSPPEPDESNA